MDQSVHDDSKPRPVGEGHAGAARGSRAKGKPAGYIRRRESATADDQHRMERADWGLLRMERDEEDTRRVGGDRLGRGCGRDRTRLLTPAVPAALARSQTRSQDSHRPQPLRGARDEKFFKGGATQEARPSTARRQNGKLRMADQTCRDQDFQGSMCPRFSPTSGVDVPTFILDRSMSTKSTLPKGSLRECRNSRQFALPGSSVRTGMDDTTLTDATVHGITGERMTMSPWHEGLCLRCVLAVVVFGNWRRSTRLSRFPAAATTHGHDHEPEPTESRGSASAPARRIDPEHEYPSH